MNKKLPGDIRAPVPRFVIGTFGLLAVVVVIVILAETTGAPSKPKPQTSPAVSAPITVSDPEQIAEILNGTAIAAAQADVAYNKAISVFGQARRDGKTLDEVAQQLKASSFSIGVAVADIQGLHHKTRAIANKDAREQMEFGMLRIYQVYEEKQSFVSDAATAIRTGTVGAVEAVAQEHAVPIKETKAKAMDAMIAFAGAKSALGMPPELTEFK